MKDFSKPFLLFSLLCSLLILNPVSATAAAPNKNQDGRTIRVTTGVVEVRGWEQGLIQGNPNLSRWHWDPIYSYKQGYSTVTPEMLKARSGQVGGTTIKPAGPVFNYPIHQDVKPTHIPHSPQAMAEVQGRLSQPPKPQLQVNGTGHEECLSGQIKSPASTMPEIATYGKLYSNNKNKALNTNLDYYSQKTAVYGHLLNTQAKKKPKSSK